MANLTLIGIVALLTAGIAVFSAAVLASAQWRNMRRPWWLVGFLVCLAALKLAPAVFEANLLLTQPVWLVGLSVLTFSIGPCLLLYTTRLSGRSFHNSDWIHAIVPALGLLLGVGVYFQLKGLMPLSPDEYRTVLFSAPPASWIGWIAIMSFLIYALLCWRQIQRMETGLRGQYSQTSRVRLNWLRQLAIGLVLIVLVDISTGILAQLFALKGSWLRVVPNFTIALYVIALSFGALRQPQLFLSNSDKSRYASSGLKEEALENYASRLEHEMISNRPYLENELNLSQLAERLRIKPHHLSQLLNEKIGKSFYDYINGYRISEACRLLENSERPVTDIAFAAGYNNKVSFYKAFKQLTGTTPVAYRNHSSVSGSKSHVK